MIRKIVTIDEEKCTGCGLCAEACHEAAIAMVDGKAKLIRDDYCDGLGACLPACPADAIQIIEREAVAFDEKAVLLHKQKQETVKPQPSGCPGMQEKKIDSLQPSIRSEQGESKKIERESQLMQWPVQIQLVSPQASYFDGARLLVAADCTAYSYGNFHDRFMKGRVTLIGCPKLDPVEYAEKLTAIIQENDIRSVTVVRMEVPCCGGIEHAVKTALQNSGKFIPWQVVVLSTDGRILEE